MDRCDERLCFIVDGSSSATYCQSMMAQPCLTAYSSSSTPPISPSCDSDDSTPHQASSVDARKDTSDAGSARRNPRRPLVFIGFISRRRSNPSSSRSMALLVAFAVTCIVTLLLPSLSTVDAQRFYYGQCPKTVPTAPNFDLKRYLGVWYDVERYQSPMHAWGACWSSTYQLQERDNSVDLVLGGILYVPNVRRGGKVYQELRNDLWNFDMTQPAKFQYRVKDVPRVFRNLQVFNGEYQVVDTDYDNWSIEWRCTNWPLGVRSEMLYIMSRRPQLENTTMTYVKRRLAEYKILDMEPLQKVNQGCTERRTNPTLG